MNDNDDFTRFWLLWRDHRRKTDGRGKARPYYDRMIASGVDPQDIYDGASWFLRNLPERDRPYIPLASSYINGEGWADDCDKEREYRARLGQASQAPNVVAMRATPVLPATHFSRQWEQKNKESA